MMLNDLTVDEFQGRLTANEDFANLSTAKRLSLISLSQQAIANLCNEKEKLDYRDNTVNNSFPT